MAYIFGLALYYWQFSALLVGLWFLYLTLRDFPIFRNKTVILIFILVLSLGWGRAYFDKITHPISKLALDSIYDKLWLTIQDKSLQRGKEIFYRVQVLDQYALLKSKHNYSVGDQLQAKIKVIDPQIAFS
ncbi:MAG TPA: hypothetical protein PLQ36_04175, partial [Candidatus Gracilibacteria bacterium]|nr:hypothetical protein [Candidatus Gracilibacteria bacterium]